LVRYGWEHAKARTKARGRVPWAYHNGRVEVVPVTLQEVLEQARALYPELGELNHETARTWAKRGLWPRATRQRGRGQGQGRVGDYPEGSPAELATAAYLMSLRYTQAEIRTVREWYLEGIPVAVPISRALAVGTSPGEAKGCTAAEQAAGALVGVWCEQSLTRQARDLLKCLRLYARTLILHRCGMGAIWPFGECRSTRIEGGRVWYMVSLPGVWLDGRHGDDAELQAADATVRGIHGEN
jgi:hypothetical protein